MIKFFYNGTKKSNDIGFGSGCVLMIGFGALIFFFTLLEDVEDLKEYLFEIILVSIMGISLVLQLTRKKGDLSSRHVVVENNYLKLDTVGVPLANIEMDIYLKESKFHRYHIRDKEGKIAIYSVHKDNLYDYILDSFPNQTHQFEELSSKQDGPYITVKAEGRKLYYNLDIGKYIITLDDGSEIANLPDIYAYDGKYKKGEPMKKTKNV